MSIIQRLSLVFIGISILIYSGCQQPEPQVEVAAPALEEGFVPIFNGENYDGWYIKLRDGDEAMGKQVFAISDGMIHVFNDTFPDEYELNQEANKTHGMIYTQKKYSHYILRFDYKWGKRIANNFGAWQYDAGLYYHIQDDKIWPVGLEYQIRYHHLENKNHTGDLIRGGVGCDWYSNDDGSLYLHPKDGGKISDNDHWMLLAAPTENFHALDGEWNACEVIVMGNAYAIHKLNGEVINMGVNLGATEGIIGFQSETAEIFYRNIRIKEFDEVVPPEQFLK
ncbi:MAG: DUF1080 domain-containing protein [Verrucomicrobiota bacterium]